MTTMPRIIVILSLVLHQATATSSDVRTRGNFANAMSKSSSEEDFGQDAATSDGLTIAEQRRRLQQALMMPTKQPSLQPTVQPTESPTCQPTFAPSLTCAFIERNVDYWGNDLNVGGKSGRVKGHLPNAEACQQACINTFGCKSWTFVKIEPAGEDNCALKRTTKEEGNVAVEAGCCDSGVVCVNDLMRTDLSYLGCFTDSNDRDLKHRQSGSYNVATCRAKCKAKNFKIFAVQYGNECFCDNDYATPANKYKRVDDKECKRNGFPDGHGGTFKNSIYSVYPKAAKGTTCTKTADCALDLVCGSSKNCVEAWTVVQAEGFELRSKGEARCSDPALYLKNAEQCRQAAVALDNATFNEVNTWMEVCGCSYDPDTQTVKFNKFRHPCYCNGKCCPEGEKTCDYGDKAKYGFGHMAKQAGDGAQWNPICLKSTTEDVARTSLAGYYTIQQKVNNRYLDAHESSGNDYSVVTRDAQNNDSQKWLLTNVGGDYYTIQQKNNNRYLDAHGWSENDYSAVTRDAQNDDSQKWLLTNVGGNYYTIQQKHKHRYLDAHEQSGNDYSVVTRDAQNNDSQKWLLTKVGEPEWDDGTPCIADFSCKQFCKNGYSWWDSKNMHACGMDPGMELTFGNSVATKPAVHGNYDYSTSGVKYEGAPGTAKDVSPENQCIEPIPLSDDANCEHVAQRTEYCNGNWLGNPIDEIILDGGGCHSLYQVKRGYRREFHVKKLREFDWQCGEEEKKVDFTKAVNKVFVNYKHENGEVQFIGHACNKKGVSEFLEASDVLNPTNSDFDDAAWQDAWDKVTLFRQDKCPWKTVENKEMVKDPEETLNLIFRNQCKAACCARIWCDAAVFRKVEQKNEKDDDDETGRAWSGTCYLYTDVELEQVEEDSSHLKACDKCDLFYIGPDRDPSIKGDLAKVLREQIDQGIKDSCSINYISALNEAHGRSPTFCKKESLPVGKAYVPNPKNWFDGQKCFGSHPEYYGGLCYQKCPRSCSTAYNRYIETEKVRDIKKGFLAPSCFTKCSDMGLVECGVEGTALYCGKDQLACAMGVGNIVYESVNAAISIGVLLMAGPAGSSIFKMKKQVLTGFGKKLFSRVWLKQKRNEMKGGLRNAAKKLGEDFKHSVSDAVKTYNDYQAWKATASRMDLLASKASAVMKKAILTSAWNVAGKTAKETVNAIMEVCGEVVNGIHTGEQIDVTDNGAGNDDDDAPWFDPAIFTDPATYDPTGILDLMEALDQPTCGQYGEEDDYNDTFQCLEDPVELECKTGDCGWCVHVDTVRTTCKGNLWGGNHGITIWDQGYLRSTPTKMAKGKEIIYSYYYDNNRNFRYDCGTDSKSKQVVWTGGLLGKVTPEVKPGDPQFNVVKATYKNDGAFEAQLYWCKSENEPCIPHNTHCDSGSILGDVFGTPHCSRCCGRSHYHSNFRDWCKSATNECYDGGHRCTVWSTIRTSDFCDGCCAGSYWDWGIFGHKCK